MDKYVVPVPPGENSRPSSRPRWKRSALELDGRISSRHRHEASRLLLDSYAEIRAFDHNYSTRSDSCPTHMARMANAFNQETSISYAREGISGLEFDMKGFYLASVTKSGCLTVHDFETLYCTTYGPASSLLEDEVKPLLHISTYLPLNAVRWNPANQDEVACASRQSDKIMLFDIGYISSEPIEVFEKGKSKSSRHNCALYNGLSDVAFASSDKSRLLAAGLDGAIYIWDRRQSNLPCLELTSNSQSQINSIVLDLEDRIVFGASKHGTIYAWDLRGGRASFAFQSHNEVYYPLLTSMKLSSLLEKITSLKAQSNITSKEIHSISFNPSCSYQLAFHLDDGWSGVLNIGSLSVTHMHCPPPPWLDGMELSASPSNLRRPSWLPTCSIYAVGSSSGNGIYLLDFYPDTSSACHVDFEEDVHCISEESRGAVQNKFVPVSQNILACASHPCNSTIIAGTKQSSLLMVSQKCHALED
ncbi:uncharacterized protein [Elaeis guineensis]|uniref:Uncharacterized protein LOC105050227 isoform X2 n=1 Tax=Elaeis guineensis var. tenera TaxID=51953 RepID=A0A6I9RLQ2_ELAGV|nr:uncharacterized protein LOC105050227 isoform X2 [Elaeis guineensis]